MKIIILVGILSTVAIKSEEVKDDSNGTKIVGGDIIDISEAPYQASLAYDRTFICGASIISTQFLLTAAHCTHDFKDKSKFTVRVGSKYSDYGGEIFKVVQVINNPNYNPNTLNFDFSLLRLCSTIKLVPKLKEVIALPPMNDKIQQNTEVFVSGFGLTMNGAAMSDSALRGVVVPIVPQNVCRQAYPLLLTGQMVCAGLSVGGKDSCSGDSGGPMQRRSDGVLIGVVSFGKGCALPKLYGVYARVASVRGWIKRTADL